MKFLSALLLTGFCAIAAANAQWVTKSYPLVKGWNGVWMAGDASHTTVAELFAASSAVMEVWRWNPNPDQVQYTSTPTEPSTSSDEWTVWKRDGSETQLSRMVGNSSYLINCSADTNLSIKQLVQPPTATWLVSGANFLGFPAAGTSSTGPLMSSYFASYPSAGTATSSTSKVYKYIGGPLSSTNPMAVVPSSEKMDPGKAYWFNVATVGNFTAPVEYEVASSAGVAFGRTLSVITVGVTNRTTSDLTLTVSLDASESAPSGQAAVTGAVPLTHRYYDDHGVFQEKPVSSGFTVGVPASGRLNLEFGINRTSMTGNSDAFYASILRLKDSQNLSDVRLPVSGQIASTAGLWACSAKVTDVVSTIQGSGTTTSQPFPLQFLIHNDGTSVRLLTQAFVGRLVTTGNPVGITTEETRVLGFQNSDVKPQRFFACQMPRESSFSASGKMTAGSSVTSKISISFDDATNPFVHKYHPDHDNRSSTGAYLTNKVESYNITRDCTFQFTADPPDGSTVQGWGTTVLGGIYKEAIAGLNNKTLNVSGTFAMRRISEISEIDSP